MLLLGEKLTDEEIQQMVCLCAFPPHFVVRTTSERSIVQFKFCQEEVVIRGGTQSREVRFEGVQRDGDHGD